MNLYLSVMTASFYRFCLLFLIVFIFGELVAQAPSGYLGKRQLIELEVDANPIFIFAQPENGLKAGVGFGAHYEYTLREHLGAGLSIDYRSFGATTAPVPRSEEIVTADDNTTALTIMLNFSFYGKKKNPGHSPIGGYLSYGLGVTNFSGVTYSRNTARPIFSEVSVSAFTGRFEWGNRYIFKDRFVLSPYARVDANTLLFDLFFDGVGPVEERPLLPNSSAMVFRAGIRIGIVQ